MDLNLDRVRANVETAGTEDLLDRATVFRAGMEPEALDIIDEELRKRGVTAGEVADHAQRRQEEGLLDADGAPLRCARCSRPAVVRRWRWGKLWGVLPMFPRRMALCAEHAGE